MTESIVSDRTLRAAQFALDGLARQQEMISHNIANIDTPGYQAKTVDFQTTLRSALKDESDSGLKLETTHSAHMSFSSLRTATSQPPSIQVLSRQGGTNRADGNNVDIDVELSQASEAVIAYQAFSQLVSKKLLLLKAIASGR